MNSTINFYNEIFYLINSIIEAAVKFDRKAPDHSNYITLYDSITKLIIDLNCYHDYIIVSSKESKIPKIINREEYYEITHSNGEIDF